MAETRSTMLPLGTVLPPFALPDAVSGRTLSSDDVRGTKGTLVMFLCNHCPFVQHVLPELRRLDRDYAGKGIGLVAINSNDLAAFPQDAPPHMKELAAKEEWSFPFLMDETQEVARAYDAVCTPEFFGFDRDLALAYHGRLDASGRNSDPHATRELFDAMSAVARGGRAPLSQAPSIGCSIKWRSPS